MQHNWDSFLYFFVVGGIFFAFGIWFPVKKGDVSWSRPEDRQAVVMIAVGMILYVGLYLVWQLHAIGAI